MSQLPPDVHQLSLLGPRGDTISLKVAGQGPALVLLHGFPMDASLWTEQMLNLSDKYQLICPDLRGFGGSTLSEDGFSLAQLADDTEFLRRHFSPNGKIALGGLSMGGYIAFEFAAKYPEALAALILMHTKPEADTDSARQSRLEMASAAESGALKDLAAGMAKNLLSEETEATVAEKLTEMIRRVPMATIAAAQRAMAGRADSIERLSKIHIPALVVSGEADALAPPTATEKWVQQMPNARHVTIKAAAHVSPLEQPDEVNSLLRRFLNEQF